MKKLLALLTALLAALATAKNHGGNRGTASFNGNELKTYSSPGSMEEVNRIMFNYNASLNASLKPNFVIKGPVEGTFINPDNSSYSEPGEYVVKNNLRNLNVFLPDTRYSVNSKVYPYRTVGTFGGCTATLVYDRGIIVTNAHCLDYDSVGNLAPSTWSKVFYAGFSNGNYLGSSTAKALWYNRYLDYAVLKLKVYLDIPLGRYGVYWRTTSFFKTNRYLSMVSYSGDHCTSWSSCYAKRSYGFTRGLVLTKSLVGPTITDIKHDLDAKRGSSGSLMYEWPYKSCCPVMDALNHAEFRNGGSKSLVLKSYVDKNANLARPSIDWKYGYDKIKYY
jgi:V8-like Glu-specific endopeptidase